MSRITQLLILFVVGGILIVGCKPAEDPMMDLLDASLNNLKIDDLTRTMDFVFSESRFEQAQFEEKMQTGLNRWANVEESAMGDGWKLPEIATGVGQTYQDLPTVQRIGELSFESTDAYFIQQAFWLRNLQQRLGESKHLNPFEIYRVAAGNYEAKEETEDRLAEVLKILHPNLDDDQSGKLSDGMRMFDWLVRNIQLEAGAEPTEADIAKQRLNSAEEGGSEAAAAGVKGTGHVRFPWQSLMYSRGDYVDRAKILLLSLDLADVDAVMFCIEDKPWCVGIAAGDQYYLFDTKLGLPIPGENFGTIATLADVQANPDLLSTLDLTVNESLKDETKYWVTADDLKNLKAKIYVTPEGISRRIDEIEKNLTGESRLKLASNPTDMISRLPKIEGIDFEAWDIAFKTHQFRRAVRDALAKSSYDDLLRDKVVWHYREEAYVDNFPLYRTARSKYFNGLFETVRNDGNANAIELFYIMIYKDDTIASLGTDTELQFKMGIMREGNQSAGDFESEISGRQNHMRLVRRDSGYFLAHCHFDNGNYGTAINWAERLRNKSDAARWLEGVEYLRGRCHEARREYKKAAEVLKKDNSQQFHGDIIRARMLERMQKMVESE